MEINSIYVNGQSYDIHDSRVTSNMTSAATPSTSGTGGTAGLMSAADKEKLDSIATGATANAGTVTGVTVGTGGTNYTPTNGIVTIPAYPEVSSSSIQAIPYIYGWDNVSASDFSGVNYDEIVYDSNNGKLYKWTYNNDSGSLAEITPGWDEYIVSLWDDNQSSYIKYKVINGVLQQQEYSWEVNKFYVGYSENRWPLCYQTANGAWYDDIAYLNDTNNLTGVLNLDDTVSAIMYSIPNSSDFVTIYTLNNITLSYKKVTYTVYVPSSNSSGALTLNFNNGPVQVHTLSANVSSISTSNIPDGHSLHVIFRSSSTSYTRTVAIAHNATTSCCPEGSALSLTVPKQGSGYTEVDFINVNNIIYVRGV